MRETSLLLFVAKATAVGFFVASGVVSTVGAAIGSSGVDIGQVAALVGASAAMLSAVTATVIALRRNRPDPLAEALAKRLLAAEPDADSDAELLQAFQDRKRKPRRRRKS